MPKKSPFEITLTSKERNYLSSLARKYTAPYRNVIRAQVILLAAEGMENKEIGEKLNLPRKTVSKWRKRFFYERDSADKSTCLPTSSRARYSFKPIQHH